MNESTTCPSNECLANDTPVLRPAYHTRDLDDGVSLAVALPGVDRDGLSVTVRDAKLLVEAERHDREDLRYRLHLRLSPRLDGGAVDASLDNGVLTLRVPLREEARPRRITIA